jgi:hypothetical protein
VLRKLVVEESSMVTTAVPAAPDSPPQPALSAMGRIFGVFFSPKSTFEDIARKPSWLLPIILLTILSIGVSVAINQRVDWREFMAQQIEKSPAAGSLSAEQKEARIEGGAKITPIFTYCIGAFGPIVFTLLVGLVMWGAYSLVAGISTNFTTAMGITAHAFLTGLISSPLFILILYLKAPGTVDMENPVATNLGAILPEDAAKWLLALCKSLDVFTIWTLILLAIGFAAVSPKKLKGGKSYTIAFGVWAVMVLCRVGFAFIFS